MAFKVNANHWDLIINFMELHPDLARGRINGPSGKETLKKLWAELTIQLNSTGLGTRSVQKWQKTWTDFKYALKKKASDIKSDLNGTGGGLAKGGNLTDLESRALNLFGSTFHEGIGRAENGCSFMNRNKEIMSQQQANTPLEAVSSINIPDPENLSGPPPSLEHNEIFFFSEMTKKRKFLDGQENLMRSSSSTLQHEKKDFIFNKNNEEKAPPDGKKSLADHNYIMQPSNKRTRKVNPEKEMEMLYHETLSELKDINSTLKGMALAINKIADALAVLANNK